MKSILKILGVAFSLALSLACGGGGGGESSSASETSTFLNLSKPDVDVGNFIYIDVSAGSDATSYPVTSSNTLDIEESDEDNVNMTDYIVLKEVSAGEFTMGSSNELFAQENESEHQVTISSNFYMGVYEITQQQYINVMGSNPSLWTSIGAARPVEEVSYDAIRGDDDVYTWPSSNLVDADSFIGKLREKTGLDIDLPTEAQWEYVCRAGTETPTFSGNNAIASGNDLRDDLIPLAYMGNSQHLDIKQTTNVGGFLPNAWGFYDMHGNVWEWCLDYYSDDLGTTAVVDPEGPASSSDGDRTLRGGSYSNYAVQSRSAVRARYQPENTDGVVGFRIMAK